MKILIKENVQQGSYPIDVPLYQRENGEMGIDYDNGNKQIIIYDITLIQAKRMRLNIDNLIKQMENKSDEQN